MQVFYRSQTGPKTRSTFDKGSCQRELTSRFVVTQISRTDIGTNFKKDMAQPYAAGPKKQNFQPNCPSLPEEMCIKQSDTQLVTHPSLIGENTLFVKRCKMLKFKMMHNQGHIMFHVSQQLT